MLAFPNSHKAWGSNHVFTLLNYANMSNSMYADIFHSIEYQKIDHYPENLWYFCRRFR